MDGTMHKYTYICKYIYGYNDSQSFFCPKEFFLKAANSTTNLTGDHLSLTFLHHQNYT